MYVSPQARYALRCNELNVLAADIQEIFGSQFELPELGPLGTHGLANPRDFESPVASFDVDQSPWEGMLRLPRMSVHIIRP